MECFRNDQDPVESPLQVPSPKWAPNLPPDQFVVVIFWFLFPLKLLQCNMKAAGNAAKFLITARRPIIANEHQNDCIYVDRGNAAALLQGICFPGKYRSLCTGPARLKSSRIVASKWRTAHWARWSSSRISLLCSGSSQLATWRQILNPQRVRLDTGAQFFTYDY